MAVVATITRGTLDVLDVDAAGGPDFVLIDLKRCREAIVAF
jgi:hypothetical protein